MIDWLRHPASAPPTIAVAGRALPVALRRNARARRLTLRLAPDGSEVRLTLPRWCSTGEALAFAAARADWLAEQAARVPGQAPPKPGGTVLHRGDTLLIEWSEHGRRAPRREGDSIIVGGPATNLPARIQRWLERDAAAALCADVAHYAGRAGIAVPEVRLTRARRRWGSCSSGGTVRINWRLIQAPDMVRRSVVAHEIAHCLHFDHSPAFHAALARIFDGDLAQADAWLKENGRSLYAAFG